MEHARFPQPFSGHHAAHVAAALIQKSTRMMGEKMLTSAQPSKKSMKVQNATSRIINQSLSKTPLRSASTDGVGVIVPVSSCRTIPQM